ncbi:MAG: DUF2752 domain-containing protein [Spirochaetales bacterium]|nr:DUF2752 domain-containing protein [Spirochaetales bacterium]
MICLVRLIFKFPCPTCGVTRAITALFSNDWKNYFYYNVFALPLLSATVLFFIGMMKKIKSLRCIALSICFLNIPYYFFRLFNNLIP